ncbi:MAG TPA: glycosyltransferase [Campylobacterales bacterium]|nr:glycosyltransferase [Campylobacterales bacterium]
MDVKKIMFVMPSLTGGGAERVMLTLIKHIDKEKFLPVFVLTKKEGRFLNVLETLPKGVEVIDLEENQARYAIFKIAKVIKEIKPDIVFSTLGYLNLLIAVIRPFYSKNIKFISRESNTVSIENRQENYPKVFDWLYKKVYNNFDLIITQSKYMRDDLIQNFGTEAEKITVINNPVDSESISKNFNELGHSLFDQNKINLIAVGRLAPQKGFDVLVDAISYLDDRFRLIILGEGNEEEALTKQIKTLGLMEKIRLLGFQHNPYAYMREADLFILSSRYEGLPNVVLESYVCGTACVAFDSPGGTAEIIEEGKTGILVKDFKATSLAGAIIKAEKMDFDREYIQNFCKTNFNVKKIVKEYENKFINKVHS